MTVPHTDQGSRAALEAAEKALSKAITHLIAFSNDEPYPDDPRWSPWTRFQKPLAKRCEEARKLVRAVLTEEERDA